MNGIAVVTAEEMKRLETVAFSDGENEEAYMSQAGEGIARVLEKELLPQTTIHVFIGKGNNGGDGFVAGGLLAGRGYPVTAYHLYPIEECSPLSQKMCKRFLKSGGKLVPLQTLPKLSEGIVLDGLLGTGFHGAVEGFLSEVIEGINANDLPVYAIDIPSGLNGNTGAVESVAIKATHTIYLGLPKLGFYLDQGWNHVGEITGVDFGLPEKYIEEAKAAAYLLSPQRATKALPKIERGRHKYQAGYVLAVAGSSAMPGAAMMACLSALKAGAGIIRLFYPEGMEQELATAPYELIKESWDLKNPARIEEEARRAKALLIGPGMGRSEEARHAASQLLATTQLPTVIDADALYFLAQDPKMSLPETSLLTPHHEEMRRILGAPPTLENCQDYAQDRSVTIVLKGAPTIVFYPHTIPLIVPHGDPGMATAGTGDVLTGILAALLAQGLDPRSGAALGVYLHALAGEIAAAHETSYGVIATNLIDYLPEALEVVSKKL